MFSILNLDTKYCSVSHPAKSVNIPISIRDVNDRRKQTSINC